MALAKTKIVSNLRKVTSKSVLKPRQPDSLQKQESQFLPKLRGLIQVLDKECNLGDFNKAKSRQGDYSSVVSMPTNFHNELVNQHTLQRYIQSAFKDNVSIFKRQNNLLSKQSALNRGGNSLKMVGKLKKLPTITEKIHNLANIEVELQSRDD